MYGELVSKNANEKTKALYAFLKENYGKHILSGQQMFGPEENEEIGIYSATGKCPAVKGYDFLHLEENPYIDEPLSEHGVDNAIHWHRDCGGIVTFCWHWFVPVDVDDPSKGRAFYTEQTPFDVTKAVTEGTKEHAVILRHIDVIAGYLKRLQDAGVPVLWRPLHEASGGWFWWGAKGPEAYKKLWNILFDRLENVHKLENLIWVWNGQHKDWIVDADKFDIGGEDIYPEKPDYSSQLDRYNLCNSYVGGQKMLTLSENAYLCDPDALIADGVKWLWWCVWWGGFAYKSNGIKSRG